MTETVVNLGEARAAFPELVDRAAAGEEIIIAKDGRPLARLCPLAEALVRRQPGGWQGKFRISDDFDGPVPDDLLDAFDGKS